MTGFVLSVPEKRVSAWFAETDPRYARAWLDSLPLADTTESAREIYRAAYTINRQDLDPQQRFELMDLYGPVVDTLCNSLQGHLTHVALPLAPKKRQIADLVRHLHTEMAFGYKACLNSLASVRLPWTRRQLALNASERAMRYLSEVLLRSYLAYLPYPVDVWREIHTLFRYAMVHGRENEPVNGGHSQAPALTIRARYLQAVLLGLTSPYQLGHGECGLIQQFLSRWAELAQLQTNLDVRNPVGYFLVDLNADAPATPFPRGAQLSESEHLLTLNTIELVRQIHTFVSRLQRGESAHSLELGLECLDSACIDLMRRLVRAWALVPRRQHSRLKRQGSVFLCVGLNALRFFSNGQRPFRLPESMNRGADADKPLAVPDLESTNSADGDDKNEMYIALDEPGAIRAENVAGAGSVVPVSMPPSETCRADRWQVCDVSPRGLLLSRTGEALNHVRVGDLLGVQRSADAAHWSVGVVRWMKSPDPASLELGVELLAPHAVPAALWPVDGQAIHEIATIALSLPAIQAMHKPATLLLSRGLFQPDRDFYLYDGSSAPRRIRLLKQLERAGTYEQVLFAAAAEH
ncbi:MAG: hypothetical protein JSW09_01265 [Pseudomonadota bacterium]|nr:MAG: hypothetical protein JSW09_01265 [Pseudomonadota bacterium]